MKFVGLLIIFTFCNYSIAARVNNFHFGHRDGGNLIPPPVRANKNMQELEFEQKLDHFDSTNDATFTQYYGVDDQYFNEDSRNVAYIFLEGEGPMSLGWLGSGLWIETAKETGALLFDLEHRFYGTSQPFKTLSTENLKYLSSEQALADAANFIESMNKKYNLTSDVKWIAFGGSYAGSLAAWLRQKYPNLVHGAISSSGPLLAKLDFFEYLEVVADDVKLTNPTCLVALQSGVEELEKVVNNSTDYEDVKELFSLCEIDGGYKNSDIALLFESISTSFSSLAQYGGDMTYYCDSLTDPSNSYFQNLVNLFKGGEGGSCLSISYSSMIEYYQYELSLSSSSRQWFYQTCTEFGFYQTTSSEAHVFGTKLPVEFFYQMCQDIYGSKFDEAFMNEAINNTNENYGALTISTDNILFVHGTADPWHMLGKLESSNEASPAILINGTSHCEDMYPSSNSDPEGLKNAKQAIVNKVLEWVK